MKRNSIFGLLLAGLLFGVLVLESCGRPGSAHCTQVRRNFKNNTTWYKSF